MPEYPDNLDEWIDPVYEEFSIDLECVDQRFLSLSLQLPEDDYRELHSVFFWMEKDMGIPAINAWIKLWEKSEYFKPALSNPKRLWENINAIFGDIDACIGRGIYFPNEIILAAKNWKTLKDLALELE